MFSKPVLALMLMATLGGAVVIRSPVFEDESNHVNHGYEVDLEGLFDEPGEQVNHGHDVDLEDLFDEPGEQVEEKNLSMIDTTVAYRPSTINTTGNAQQAAPRMARLPFFFNVRKGSITAGDVVNQARVCAKAAEGTDGLPIFVQVKAGPWLEIAPLIEGLFSARLGNPQEYPVKDLAFDTTFEEPPLMWFVNGELRVVLVTFVSSPLTSKFTTGSWNDEIRFVDHVSGVSALKSAGDIDSYDIDSYEVSDFANTLDRHLRERDQVLHRILFNGELARGFNDEQVFYPWPVPNEEGPAVFPLSYNSGRAEAVIHDVFFHNGDYNYGPVERENKYMNHRGGLYATRSLQLLPVEDHEMPAGPVLTSLDGLSYGKDASESKEKLQVWQKWRDEGLVKDVANILVCVNFSSGSPKALQGAFLKLLKSPWADHVLVATNDEEFLKKDANSEEGSQWEHRVLHVGRVPFVKFWYDMRCDVVMHAGGAGTTTESFWLSSAVNKPVAQLIYPNGGGADQKRNMSFVVKHGGGDVWNAMQSLISRRPASACEATAEKALNGLEPYWPSTTQKATPKDLCSSPQSQQWVELAAALAIVHAVELLDKNAYLAKSQDFYEEVGPLHERSDSKGLNIMVAQLKHLADKREGGSLNPSLF